MDYKDLIAQTQEISKINQSFVYKSIKLLELYIYISENKQLESVSQLNIGAIQVPLSMKR